MKKMIFKAVASLACFSLGACAGIGFSGTVSGVLPEKHGGAGYSFTVHPEK